MKLERKRLIRLNKILKELAEDNVKLKAVMTYAKWNFNNVPEYQQNMILKYKPLMIREWNDL